MSILGRAQQGEGPRSGRRHRTPSTTPRSSRTRCGSKTRCATGRSKYPYDHWLPRYAYALENDVRAHPGRRGEQARPPAAQLHHRVLPADRLRQGRPRQAGRRHPDPRSVGHPGDGTGAPGADRRQGAPDDPAASAAPVLPDANAGRAPPVPTASATPLAAPPAATRRHPPRRPRPPLPRLPFPTPAPTATSGAERDADARRRLRAPAASKSPVPAARWRPGRGG